MLRNLGSGKRGTGTRWAKKGATANATLLVSHPCRSQGLPRILLLTAFMFRIVLPTAGYWEQMSYMVWGFEVGLACDMGAE